jgi:hypothetical protein
MTEEEWLACNDTGPMLHFFQGKRANRKFRLFACACCRRQWHLLTDKQSRRAVEAAELYADQKITRRDLFPVSAEVHKVCRGWPWSEQYPGSMALKATHMARWVAGGRSWGVAETIARHWEPSDQGSVIALLHEVFGNPFRPVTLDPAWLSWHDGAATLLAQAVYDERRFEDMPILADLLEEAGCTNADILNHCRDGGQHVRGCWVVDLVLGKS